MRDALHLEIVAECGTAPAQWARIGPLRFYYSSEDAARLPGGCSKGE